MALETIGTQNTPFAKRQNVESHKQTSSAELMQSIQGAYTDLINLYGKEAADAYILRMMKNPASRRTQRDIKAITTLEEAKSQALNELEKQEILKNSPEGLLVCDIEKLKTFFISTESVKARQALGPIYGSKHYGSQKFTKTLTLLFDGVKVVSEEDYQNGVREPKDLFYLPDNAEDALDVEKIKQSNFYLTLYDAAKPIFNPSEGTETTRYGNMEDLDYREVLVPLIIYHPQYGDGYRDPKTGQLMVRDPKTRQYKKITGESFFEAYVGRPWIGGLSILDSSGKELKRVGNETGCFYLLREVAND